MCLARSPMVEVARSLGVPCVEEAFADRAYAPDGTLVPRRRAGAVFEDAEAVAARVSGMVRERQVLAIDGTLIPLEARSVCVHGDTPGAEQLVAAIRARLAADGIAVRPFGALG